MSLGRHGAVFIKALTSHVLSQCCEAGSFGAWSTFTVFIARLDKAEMDVAALRQEAGIVIHYILRLGTSLRIDQADNAMKWHPIYTLNTQTNRCTHQEIELLYFE